MPTASRRRFIATTAAALVALLFPRARALAGVPARSGRDSGHPTPRPGITAAKVLTRRQLAGSPKLIPIFDAVRAIPGVVDGIRCNCGCAGQPGFYSLLSCYEGGEAMARSCAICQGQGQLAARLHRQGKTLDQIRAAVDARFG
jgi:hypothetical protein